MVWRWGEERQPNQHREDIAPPLFRYSIRILASAWPLKPVYRSFRRITDQSVGISFGSSKTSTGGCR